MALTDREMDRIEAQIDKSVRAGVAEAALRHFRECPQAQHVEALFRKTDETTKQINGVASSVEKVASAVETARQLAGQAAAQAKEAAKVSEAAKDAAEKLGERRGLSRGMMIGMALSAAGGAGGTVALAKLIPALLGH